MAKRQNALGNLVNLEQQIVIQLFELHMQLEEVIALDVPVVSPDVHVKDLVVGKQIIERIRKLFRFLGIKTNKVLTHNASP